ncbi:hypothetical protein KH5_08700 [Urechidicola sp. KH5]
MKKLYFLFSFLFVAGISFGQELLLNGDFESWDNPNSPTSWTKAESVDQESAVANVNGGAYSAKHTGGTSDLTQEVSGIIPGNSYTLTLWYKVDPGFGDGTDARIWSYWLNGASTVTDAATDAILRGPNNNYFDNNGNIWTEYTATINAPAGVNGFRFEVRTYGTAVVYWDDFSFFAEAASPDPGLTISAPTEGEEILTDEVDVSYIVSNFDVQDGTGDGRIRYTLDSDPAVLVSNTDPISLTGLSDGAHTMYMELVDNSNNVLSPEVNATVNFTVNNIVQTLPFLEPFNYTAGQTLGDQNIWVDNFSGTSPDIASGSLNYSTLMGSGNSVSFIGSGADPTVDYTPTSSGKIYASFIMDVTDLSSVTGNGYFAILRADDGQYRCRLFTEYIDADTYNIGVSASSTLTVSTGPFNDNTSIFVVMSYDLDNDIVSAWVNPAFGGAEPSADISEASGTSGVTLSQFMIRQASATQTPGITLDELRIGTSWADVAGATLSVPSNNQIEGFAMYPNPVSNGYLTIRSNSNAEKSIQVFDVIGKQVFTTTTRGSEALDVSNISKGVYILKVSEEGKTATRKLIIE